MGVGINIFLIAVGAILAFAVDVTIAGLDIKVVGVILMAAGVVGLVLTLLVSAPRRRRMVTQTAMRPVIAPNASSRVVTTDGVTGPSIL